MLDLGFVREHLPLIEEKLRLRGMDPGAVLGDFQALDGERRRLITEAETLKAQRNRAAEEIARLKKDKKDAEQLVAQNKGMRTRGEAGLLVVSQMSEYHLPTGVSGRRRAVSS